MIDVKPCSVVALGALLPLLLVLLLGAASIVTARSSSGSTHRALLREIAVLGILACGMTVVIVSAGIDLSVGSVLGLCAVLFALLQHAARLLGRRRCWRRAAGGSSGTVYFTAGPFAQRTSSEVTSVAAPRPKCTRRSDWDACPRPLATSPLMRCRRQSRTRLNRLHREGICAMDRRGAARSANGLGRCHRSSPAAAVRRWC